MKQQFVSTTFSYVLFHIQTKCANKFISLYKLMSLKTNIKLFEYHFKRTIDLSCLYSPTTTFIDL